MSTPPHPTDSKIVDIWRVGLVAYRACGRRMYPERQENHWEGVAAIRAAYPQLTKEEASRQMTLAVCWASAHHHAWLNRGVIRREWIWPRDHRGVGTHRNPGYEDA